MAIYRFKIVGVHYAVNPDSASSAEETELMHQRTAQRLSELDETRPRIVLVPEPTNPADPRAVMARVMGKRIGYVDKTQLDMVHSLLHGNGGRPLIASIVEVEARKHGWLYVALEASGEIPVEPLPKAEDAWKEWTSTIPAIAPDEAYFAREEAEVMLDDVLSKHPIFLAPQSIGEASVVDIGIIEHYIRLWLESSLHDLSYEARLTREHYIMRLKETMLQNAAPLQETVPRIRALVYELEKQRTAICGQKRSTLRVAGWWKELIQSAEMQHLWNTWMARCGEGMEQGLNELVTPLKALPYDLYAYIDDKKLFFSRLHYSGVPRAKYWQIVSLMLLRERLQKELGSDTRPQGEGGGPVLGPRHEHKDGSPVLGHPYEQEEETRNETFTVIIPKELQSAEARKILAKLQKKGLLDADLQPSTLVGWQKGVLAYELTERLKIAKKWVVMATLWKCSDKTLRQNYSKNFNEQKSIDFSKQVKALVYSV